MVSGVDLLPTKPPLLSFFVAYISTISAVGKAYKKRSGFMPTANGGVVFCRQKKESGG